MSITRNLAAKHLKHYDTHGEYLKADAIRHLIVSSLERQERDALRLVRQRFVLTTDIQKDLGISNKHAYMLMLRLHNLGLVMKRYYKGQCEWLARREPLQEEEIE